MKTIVTLLCMISTIFALGARNNVETNGAMNGMLVDIDWSGLVNQMQPAQQMMAPQVAPAPVVMPMVMPAPQVSMQEHGVAVAPGFMEVSSSAEIQLSSVNTPADLIVRSWANTWSMLSQDPNSSISLIYAAYKPLEGADGVHWRLVFVLNGSGNTEFVGLDIAVLANGTIDIFRNIQTRNLTDISVLFGTTISASNSIAYENLKESFFHNAPLALNPDYNAAMANQSSFNIEWLTVQNVQQAPQQDLQLNMILNGVGGNQQQEFGVMETNVDIGSDQGDDGYNMFG